jgi:DNA-binding GntR family transcriptional regulator
MTISRSRGLPLYRQVAAALEDRIAGGATSPGQQLPREAELAAEFGVNRLTVRQALAELVQRGLIRTVHGVGSFVAEPAIRHDISGDREPSLRRAMLERGHEVEQRLLAAGRDDDPTAQAALGTRGHLWRFELLRFVDGVPWTHSRTWLPERRFRRVVATWDGSSSLYDALEAGYGLRLRRAERTLWTEAAGPLDAERLLVPVGSPILVMSGHNVSQEGEPVTALVHRGRGDRVHYRIRYDRDLDI